MSKSVRPPTFPTLSGKYGIDAVDQAFAAWERVLKCAAAGEFTDDEFEREVRAVLDSSPAARAVAVRFSQEVSR